jgi:phospholipid-binding lipoprotein MlaA
MLLLIILYGRCLINKFILILVVATLLLSIGVGSFAADNEIKASSTPVVEITASKPEEEDFGYIESEGDPLEPVNRGIFAFNEAVDDFLIQPVARTYKGVVPEWGRDRVGNFFENLSAPVTFLNSVLQGDVDNAFATFWRFMINTTFGIGGLFDQAEIAGLAARDEDFGQTLGHYGADPGTYLVLPFIGPTTTRDAVGLVADSVTNPFNYVSGEVIIGHVVGEGVHDRSEVLDLTDEIDRTSFDPYSTYRSAYFQKRKDLVTNGGEK